MCQSPLTHAFFTRDGRFLLRYELTYQLRILDFPVVGQQVRFAQNRLCAEVQLDGEVRQFPRDFGQSLGTLAELPTHADAAKKADSVRREIRLLAARKVPTVDELIEHYRVEKMPERFSTRHGYEAWIKNHIRPRWGELPSRRCNPVRSSCGCDRCS